MERCECNQITLDHVGGFVKDYTVWIHHGEAVVDVEPEEEIHDAVDEDGHTYMDACIDDLNGEIGGHE